MSHRMRPPLETPEHARRPVYVWGVGMLLIVLGVILAGFEAISDDASHRAIFGVMGCIGTGLFLVVVGLVWSFRRKP